MTREEAFIKACKEEGYDKHAVDIEDAFVGEFKHESDFKNYVINEFCDLNNISDKLRFYLDEELIMRDLTIDEQFHHVDEYYFNFSRA